MSKTGTCGVTNLACASWSSQVCKHESKGLSVQSWIIEKLSCSAPTLLRLVNLQLGSFGALWLMPIKVSLEKCLFEPSWCCEASGSASAEGGLPGPMAQVRLFPEACIGAAYVVAQCGWSRLRLLMVQLNPLDTWLRMFSHLDSELGQWNPQCFNLWKIDTPLPGPSSNTVLRSSDKEGAVSRARLNTAGLKILPCGPMLLKNLNENYKSCALPESW